VNGRSVHNMPFKQRMRLLCVVFGLSVFTAGAQEQLEQETISIKGNRGLPKTLYIAPWKRVGAPLESGRLEGEVGEDTKPVEREMFQHELELQRQGYSLD